MRIKMLSSGGKETQPAVKRRADIALILSPRGEVGLRIGAKRQGAPTPDYECRHLVQA